MTDVEAMESRMRVISAQLAEERSPSMRKELITEWSNLSRLMNEKTNKAKAEVGQITTGSIKGSATKESATKKLTFVERLVMKIKGLFHR